MQLVLPRLPRERRAQRSQFAGITCLQRQETDRIRLFFCRPAFREHAHGGRPPNIRITSFRLPLLSVFPVVFFMEGCEDNYIYFHRYPRQYGHMRPYFESRRDHKGRATACSTAGAKDGGEDIVEFTQTMSSPLFYLSLFAIHAVSFAEVPKGKTSAANLIRLDCLFLSTRFLKATKHLVKPHKQGRQGLFSIELFLTNICQKNCYERNSQALPCTFLSF